MKTKNKVFCIGMFKTGTTSIGNAFQILGYKTLMGPWWPKDIMIIDDWGLKSQEEWNEYDEVILNKTKEFDAFQDYPWMFCFKKCYEWYPDAKFILLERNPEKLAESDINMWRKERVPEDKIPKKEKFIRRYQNQFDEAVEFFEGKENFMIMDIKEGWEKLCPFLGEEIPKTPFPHSNKGIYIK
jgi:hypothetical protein